MHKKIFSFVIVCAVSSLMFASDYSSESSGGKGGSLKDGDLYFSLTGEKNEEKAKLYNITFTSEHPMGCRDRCNPISCPNPACKLGSETILNHSNLTIEGNVIFVKTKIDGEVLKGRLLMYNQMAPSDELFVDELSNAKGSFSSSCGFYINGIMQPQKGQEKNYAFFISDYKARTFIEEAKKLGLMKKNFIDNSKENWTYHHGLHLALVSLVIYLLLHR